MISVQCGEGWITFDNSCYKYESSPDMIATLQDGQDFCSKTSGGHLMVPNSVEEAAFIGSYLSSLQVCFCFRCFNYYFSKFIIYTFAAEIYNSSIFHQDSNGPFMNDVVQIDPTAPLSHKNGCFTYTWCKNTPQSCNTG